ncbi:hypothetical protein DOTSEDRAFT_76014 [Dothistroma septosporum NZE10]|uniref:Major facilitator superfamily (MFS) profile domain-containing protein n=1 Tax=Dothistroma septosporum (strain NZE10 / CBS 128990) TaxID=675120 RepID=N1Q114_DOTSN|nr:hypothetical protein DOTSEDRAFT_76014 [Dothistroma septosporum NZE10]
MPSGSGSQPNGSSKRQGAPSLHHRTSSTLHYQTFPTPPPKSAGKPPPKKDGMRQNGAPDGPPSPSLTRTDSHESNQHHETPLPKGQLAILAVIALAEQTALNSISPYLPDMASSFPEVDEAKIGLYVGIIASAFAGAQFATNFMWGWLSDRIGRKPVVLTGTILTAACFVAFGFSRRLWQAILVQALMGLVNGNQGVISTCLGEITDRSNQSRAFTYLPVIYGIGGITGPLLGGLLVIRENPFREGQPNPYPYLLPNLFAASVLLIDFVLTAIFLKESLDASDDLPPLKKRFTSMFAWIWQFAGNSSSPTYVRRASKSAHENHDYQRVSSRDGAIEEEDYEDEEEEDDDHFNNVFATANTESLEWKDILNRDVVLLLATYLIFQLSNISYNSLYPIFSEAKPPTGRNLSPSEVGTSLAIAGAITITFQAGVFERIRSKIGNRITYRAGLAGFVLAFILMPFVGYKDGANGRGEDTTAGKVWLWAELGVVLIIKTLAGVGGLTSALLLITNSAPSHAVLGSVNGLAQTLSAGGRAVGPFVSGGLFTAATYVKPKGELMAFGIFAGISFIGFLMSFGIRGVNLESDDWSEDDTDDEESALVDESDAEHSPERGKKPTPSNAR